MKARSKLSPDSSEISAYFWSDEDLSRMIALVARIHVPDNKVRDVPEKTGVQTLHQWIHSTAILYGMEAHRLADNPGKWAKISTNSLIVTIDEHETQFLLVLRSKNGTCEVLGPGGERLYISWPDLFLQVTARPEVGGYPQAERYADLVDLETFEQKLIERGLLKTRSLEGWTFRSNPQAPLLRIMREQKLIGPVVILTITQLLATGSMAAFWGFLGFFALSPNIEGSLFWLWAVVALGSVFFQSIAGFVSRDAMRLLNTYLKRYLMVGAMELDNEQVRAEGTGKSLTRAFEADGLASTISGAVIEVVTTLGQLVYVFAALQLGLHPALLTGMFIGILVILGVMLRSFWVAAGDNVSEQMAQTHWLFDYVNGFRTKVVQGAPWSLAEVDRSLSAYATKKQHADTLSALLLSVVPYVWLILSLSMLFFTAAAIDSESLPQLGITLGSIVFGYMTLKGVAGFMEQIIPALASWNRVGILFRAAREQKPSQHHATTLQKTEVPEGEPLLSFQNLSFRYKVNGRDVLRGLNWKVFPGDQILLSGPSGSGKSTLVSILAGLRDPTGGLFFVCGSDARTLRARSLREAVALAPQFHENIILQGSLLFNLCLGYKWPLEDSLWGEVEELCRELGLGELIDSMPSGMQQVVGEGGWRLSHGEKSRVFLARTLLQNAPVLILDESFSALDPDLVRQCMQCVRKRAKALIVISHN